MAISPAIPAPEEHLQKHRGDRAFGARRTVNCGPLLVASHQKSVHQSRTTARTKPHDHADLSTPIGLVRDGALCDHEFVHVPAA